MALEEGVIDLLIGGFAIVMGIALFTTLLLWIKNRNNSTPYICTILHFILSSISAYFSVKAISFDNQHPMASEEISLQIGIAGVVWALGMLCFLTGIFKFSKK